MINEAITVLNFLKRRPMLFLSIASAVSVLLIYYSFFTAIIFAALCIILMFILNYKNQSGVFVLCGILLLLTMLSAAHTLNDIDRCESLDFMMVSGEFVVVSASQNNTDSYLCDIEVIDCDYLQKGDKLSANYSGPKIEVGKTFRAKAKLSKIEDGITAKSFYSQEIYLFADLSDIVLTNNDDFILSGINRFRKYIKTEIFKYFGENEAATMLALLTGDRTYLSDSFYSNLKSAGVMHAMVVSGMHLSIIVGFTLLFVNKFIYNRFLKAFAIFITVLSVAAVCGFTMSIMRAGLTYLVISLALLIGRRYNPENSLGVAVSIVLLLNPLAIFSVSFQLSVLSTFGILSVALPVSEFLRENRIIKLKIMQKVVSAVLITLSALLFTLPVTISVFGYVSNMSLVSNLLTSYAITLVIRLCILGFVLFPLRSVIFYITSLIIKYINAVVNYFGSAEFAVTYLPNWAAPVSAVAIFLILCILLACAKRENMLKLKSVVNKKIIEGGEKLKWPSFLRKR
ncbi:MAG: ComEC/Rec2 family competence protein [Clostridia bacterium]|nr:ComEC/Rec2 family competence protein [Clostridia bacterium]